MMRWLAIAEWLCGHRARRDVFEPLVADWHRELSEARPDGHWDLARAFVSGAAAYAISLTRCAMTGAGWLPTPRASLTALVAFMLAANTAALILLAMTYPWGPPIDLGSMQTQAFLMYSASLVMPPALLPALFLMRRERRSTVRHAILALGLGAAVTAAAVVLTSPEAVNAYFSTFEAYEREYARSRANDRAGRYSYPGTAVRQLRGDRTPEQRRADFERWDAMRSESIVERPPLTWQQRARRLQPMALAVAFGIIGWTLAGLGAVSFTRAIVWWGLMLAAVVTLTASMPMLHRISVYRMPSWTVVPMFAAITAALVIASWRQHRPPAPTP